jgi:hypothetical protein
MHHTQIWILVEKIMTYEDVTPLDYPLISGSLALVSLNLT